MAKDFPERTTAEDELDLEQMRTQDLEELLRQDAHSSCGGGFSAEFIERVLGVIEKRERLRPKSVLPDIDEAWSSFQANYLPDVGDYPEVFSEEAADQTADSRGVSKPLRRRIRPLIVAAVICAILGSTLVAQASGVDIWGALARWTSEVFHFGQPETGFQPPVASGADVEYSSLEEALDAYHSSLQVCPTWWPSGFELNRLSVHSSRDMVFINALYCKDQQTISIIVRLYPETQSVPTASFEKDQANLCEYRKGGITHYVMQNLGKLRVTWVNKQAACSLSGDITQMEIEKMIDSIYKG